MLGCDSPAKRKLPMQMEDGRVIKLDRCPFKEQRQRGVWINHVLSLFSHYQNGHLLTEDSHDLAAIEFLARNLNRLREAKGGGDGS